MSSNKTALRQRPNAPKESSPSKDSSVTQQPLRNEVVWGKTPSGEGIFIFLLEEIMYSAFVVFRVPTTHDVLTTLFHPGYPKSHLDLLNLSLLAFQILLFVFLPRRASQAFFFVYFAFWRGLYDLGLGWVLTKQSKKKWIVREVQRLGWLDNERRPRVRQWIKEQLVGKMGKDYDFDVS
jgi:phosphatidylethanolamine N-methyltransferase